MTVDNNDTDLEVSDTCVRNSVELSCNTAAFWQIRMCDKHNEQRLIDLQPWLMHLRYHVSNVNSYSLSTLTKYKLYCLTNNNTQIYSNIAHNNIELYYS